MDDESRALFAGGVAGGWKAFGEATEADAERLAHELFGERFTPTDAARLVGSPGVCHAEVYVDEGGLTVESTKGTSVQLLRRFRREGGLLVVEHQFSDVIPKRRRTSPRILGRAVQEYRAMGISRIECRATGNPGSEFSGYIVWPVLGFNLTFDDRQRALVEAAGFEAKDTHELFLRYDEEGGDNGVDWWAENGSTGDAEFELDPDSPHSDILATYLKKRGIQL